MGRHKFNRYNGTISGQKRREFGNTPHDNSMLQKKKGQSVCEQLLLLEAVLKLHEKLVANVVRCTADNLSKSTH